MSEPIRWALSQFPMIEGKRKKCGRPAQDSYLAWTAEEIDLLRQEKGRYGWYTRVAAILGRSRASVKSMGQRL